MGYSQTLCICYHNSKHDLSGRLNLHFLEEKAEVSPLNNIIASVNNHRHTFSAYDYNQGKA